MKASIFPDTLEIPFFPEDLLKVTRLAKGTKGQPDTTLAWSVLHLDFVISHPSVSWVLAQNGSGSLLNARCAWRLCG
jgi:hypothetical protein